MTHPELIRLRGRIDEMDAELIGLLARRFAITRQVGQLKARIGLPPADPGREAEQIARLRQLALEADLDPQFAESVLSFIVAEVVRHHERIALGAQGAGSGDDVALAGLAGDADDDGPGRDVVDD